MGSAGEFAIYAVIGAIGLLMTLGTMYVFTDLLKIYFMLSKIIATVIMLIWNFLAGKLLIYRVK